MWTGQDVPLAEFAARTNGGWVQAPYAKPPYNWIMQRDVDTDKNYGLAHLKDVNIFNVFNIFDQNTNLFCTGVSYIQSLINFRVQHQWNGDTLSVETPKREVTIPGYVVLVGGSSNHYHWLLNWLPRYWIWKRLAEQLGAPMRVKIAVHYGISQQHLAILGMLGIAEDDLIIMRTDVYTYRVENLYVPSFFSSHCYYVEVLRFLNRLGEKVGGEAIPGIFVSRRKIDFPRRRILNEDALAPILARHGVQMVEFENISMSDQIRLFRNSWAIIGPHGAGMANLAFSKRGADCLLFEYKAVSEFSELAMLCDVRCEAHITPQVTDADYEAVHPTQPRNRDFIVAPETVERFLASVAQRRH